MSFKRIVPPALIAAGVGLLIIGLASGSVRISLFIIFPVFSGSGPLFFASVVLIVAGFFTIPLVMTHENEPLLPGEGLPDKGPALRAGAVIFIGPIPILLASDRRTALYTMLAALILLLILFFFAVT